jgi:hypothetical protein
LYKAETIDDGTGTATELDKYGDPLADFNGLYEFTPAWNSSEDFFGGDITWSGSAYFDTQTYDCLYLIVKDGGQDPAAYAFDLLNLDIFSPTPPYETWNGTDTLHLTNFWIGDGSISHVEIRGCGGTPIPEPATMLLLGTGLIGLAGIGRKKFKK